MSKVVILDNGHGSTTLGKRSPDGRLLEWRWTREFVSRLKPELELLGYKVFNIVPEDDDIKLSTRAKRANQIVAEYGASNCVFISVHCNAASTSGWAKATGFEVWTTEGNNNSDRLAEFICDACVEHGVKLRTDMTDNDKDKEHNFTVIYMTNCPAVITENLFMDSKNDVEFLLSEDGIQTLLDIHIDGIHRYFGGPVSIIEQ